MLTSRSYTTACNSRSGGVIPKTSRVQTPWLIDFLAGEPLSALHVLPKLEHHLEFMRERRIRRPDEEPALLDLIAKLREIVVQQHHNSSENETSNSPVTS